MTTFQVLHTAGQARQGRFLFHNGKVLDTPAFIPAGNIYGAIKGMHAELPSSNTQILLAPTLNIWLRPGTEVIKSVHQFLDWQGVVFTDSESRQIFNLKTMPKITEEGIYFHSPLDGRTLFLRPEDSMATQKALDAEIHMTFYAGTATDYQSAKSSMERSLRWAQRCKETHARPALLFGMIQGAKWPDLQHASLQGLMDLNLDGYVLGELSTHQTLTEQLAILSSTDKPRVLTGIETPQDIVAAVKCGVDLIEGRLPSSPGTIITSHGTVHLDDSRHKFDLSPLDPHCSCYTCQNYSKAYLHHLNQCQEMLGARLNNLHNLHYYQNFMLNLRRAIEQGTLQ